MEAISCSDSWGQAERVCWDRGEWVAGGERAIREVSDGAVRIYSRQAGREGGEEV